MQYFEIMQSFETPRHLDRNAPNLFLSKFGAIFAMVIDFLVKISIVGKLHDDAIWDKGY